MGGMDLSDALIQYYTIRGTTMKWYKTSFYHFIDISLVNSFIVFKMLDTGRAGAPLSQRQCREVFMKELTDQPKPAVAGPALKSGPSNICIPAYHTQSASKKRRKCVFWRQQGRTTMTPIFCRRCNVALSVTINACCRGILFCCFFFWVTGYT